MNKSDFDWSWLDFMMRLAYPEKYAKDYQEWFSGDGPAEQYFGDLSDLAKSWLKSNTETRK